MQNTWTYPAVFERDGDEIIVHFPDVPEALTGTSTMEEARLLAADALEEVILHYLAEGMPIPLPRAANKGEEAVALDGRIAKHEKIVDGIVSGKVAIGGEHIQTTDSH